MAGGDNIPDVPAGDDEPVSDAELAFWDRPLEQIPGIDRFDPNKPAPPVDLELLRAYESDELPDPQKLVTVCRILQYPSWKEAARRVRMELGLGPFSWDRHPSIYEHLRAHLPVAVEKGDRHLAKDSEPVPVFNGLMEGGEVLPDAHKFADDWDSDEPGSRDELNSFFPSPALAADLLKLVLAYCKSPTVQHKLTVYDFVLAHDAIHWCDDLPRLLGEQPGLNLARLHDLARSFATEAPDREPVKFGICVLGPFRPPRDHDIIRVLGRHEEFTRYCAAALNRTAENPEAELWSLAQNVHGLGKTNVLKYLAETKDARIQDWLLREGLKNSSWACPQAYLCATAGRLLAALQRPEIDDELLAAAGEIIGALFYGDESGDLDDYPDALAVVGRYVALMESRASTLSDLLAIADLRHLLAGESDRWQPRADLGWTPEIVGRLCGQCSAILDRPLWRVLVTEGLRSPDDDDLELADRAACVLGIDTWELHRQRFLDSPKNPRRWMQLPIDDNAERMMEMLALADRLLPLETATQEEIPVELLPALLVPDCLNVLLLTLGAFPGMRPDLLRLGLRSRYAGNRHRAVMTLGRWGRDDWPAGTTEHLEELQRSETDHSTKIAIYGVLAGVIGPRPAPTRIVVVALPVRDNSDNQQLTKES